jgi:hypothetical protein
MVPFDLTLMKVGHAEPSDLHGTVGTGDRVTMTSGTVPLGQSVPQTTEYVVVALWLFLYQHDLTISVLKKTYLNTACANRETDQRARDWDFMILVCLV